MTSLLSISEAAKKVGLSRPRLSKLIKKYELPKTPKNGTFLVNEKDVIHLVKTLRAKGEVRPLGASCAPEKPSALPPPHPDFLEKRLAALEAATYNPQQSPTPGIWGFLKDAFSPW